MKILERWLKKTLNIIVHYVINSNQIIIVFILFFSLLTENDICTRIHSQKHNLVSVSDFTAATAFLNR